MAREPRDLRPGADDAEARRAATRVLRLLRDSGAEDATVWYDYVYEVIRANRRMALVSRRHTEETIARLVRESMAMWEVAEDAAGRPPARVVDVGTGAGFPGLVWRIARPSLALALVERRERRAAFVEHVVARLRLERVEVEAGDASTLPRRRPDWVGAFELATGLAVAPPDRLLPWLRPLLSPQGIVVTTVPRDDAPPAAVGDLRRVRDVTRPEARVVVYAPA